MFLKRFTCPFRHSDIVPRFAKLVSQICMATNNIINHIYTNFGHLLKDFEYPWLASQPWLAMASNATTLYLCFYYPF